MRNKSTILATAIVVLSIGLIAGLIVLKNQSYTPDDNSIEIQSQTAATSQQTREVAHVTPDISHKTTTQVVSDDDDLTEQAEDQTKSNDNTEEVQELTDDTTSESASTQGTESESILSGNYVAKITKKAENQVSVSELKEDTVTISIAESVYSGTTFQSDNGVTYKLISLSDYIKAAQPKNTTTNELITERELNDYLVKNYRCPLPTVICSWESNKKTMYGVFTTASYYGKLYGKSLYSQSTAEDIKEGKYGICNLNIGNEDAKNRNVLFGTDSSSLLTCPNTELLDSISFSQTYLGIIAVNQNELSDLLVIRN